MQFVDDTHRKRWERAQLTYKAKQAAKRPGLPEEYAEAVGSIISAVAGLQHVADQLRGDIMELLLLRLQGLRSTNPIERAQFEADGMSGPRGHLRSLVKLAAYYLDDLKQAEDALLNGELGDDGDELLLHLLATVPGLALEAGEMAGDEDEDDEEDEA
jgi:hypothetical protein